MNIESDARSSLNRHLSLALAHHNIGRPTHARLHGVALVCALLRHGVMTKADLDRAVRLMDGNLALEE